MNRILVARSNRPNAIVIYVMEATDVVGGEVIRPYAGRRRGVRVPAIPDPETRLRELVARCGVKGQCPRCLFPVWRFRSQDASTLLVLDRDGADHWRSCPW